MCRTRNSAAVWPDSKNHFAIGPCCPCTAQVATGPSALRAGNVRGACYASHMGEGCTELDARLEAVANAAALLPWRLPRVRDPAFGRWMAHAIDALLRNVSSGHGGLDVAIGEGLDALTVGRRAMDLSYSNVGDYAREELGINASTAVKMARLARRLQDRPLVREAVRRGELTARKAEIIAPVAVGDDQARWILVAKAETVRALKVRVKAPPDPDDEEWVNLCADVLPEKLPTLDEGLRLAGVIIGATATKMQRVNAWAAEYLSSIRRLLTSARTTSCSRPRTISSRSRRCWSRKIA